MTDWELDCDEQHLVRQELEEYISPPAWRNKGSDDAIANRPPKSKNKDYLVGYRLGQGLKGERP